jgi:hypothetical protein
LDSYRPAFLATRSCPNNGRIRFLTSRSGAAHNASVSSIDAVCVHDLRIMVAHGLQYRKGNCHAKDRNPAFLVNQDTADMTTANSAALQRRESKSRSSRNTTKAGGERDSSHLSSRRRRLSNPESSGSWNYRSGAGATCDPDRADGGPGSRRRRSIFSPSCGHAQSSLANH